MADMMDTSMVVKTVQSMADHSAVVMVEELAGMLAVMMVVVKGTITVDNLVV